ncbi:BTB domain-containing protein [Mycena indigotica]|uniref:BTB domain-containing protein n=1 Tax=Mycena indigotica TaxID=2126181 RepID=A0A8H6SGV5_9AGAR|nr:BTB domain-containing protein [Mycena indigotica]KAF7298657.1 BTB domain-containing protein [Mycena indigotica]
MTSSLVNGVVAADSDSTSNSVGKPSESPPASDEHYFFDDGDCVLQVEGVQFKLHKAFLTRDPESMFCAMFKDATGENDDIIPLHGDTAADFRALCSLLYIRPGDAYSRHKSPFTADDVKVYLAVLDLSNKYGLAHFEKWAQQLLEDAWPVVQEYLVTCPEDTMEKTMGIAIRCAHKTLLAEVDSKWLASITEGVVTAESALAAGESYGRRSFQGDVYAALRSRVRSTSLFLSPQVGLKALGLTEDQLHRFLTGFTILTHVLIVLTTAGQTLDTSPTCDTTPPNQPPTVPPCDCQSHWDELCQQNYHDSFELGVPDIRLTLQRTKDRVDAFPCIKEHLSSDDVAFCEDLDEYFLGPKPANNEPEEVPVLRR